MLNFLGSAGAFGAFAAAAGAGDGAAAGLPPRAAARMSAVDGFAPAGDFAGAAFSIFSILAAGFAAAGLAAAGAAGFSLSAFAAPR